ncbi:hypothetical protein CHELA1G11_60033 [Hyphomicrobiales bacterium]|nr:hypothetical protein CHELA20_20012 [Hyphomicrobiales bacterium]CAH1696722.1 hypothetical protein CHELA1G2_50032 [Hyphomicrobiales bacterium]CAH1696877.1 hypothetical protein CHELA1G11_60033 [Hyphomicrobiales bacterium]
MTGFGAYVPFSKSIRRSSRHSPKLSCRRRLSIPSMPGVRAPLDARTIRAASASHFRSAMSRRRRSNRRFGSLSAHAASLCCISLIIKGLHLVWSGNLHSKQLELFPFAMWRVFPTPDYYGNSASMVDIRVNSLGIPTMPSLVHMPDLKRTGEAAGRSLFPCIPQVDADAMAWLHSLHGPGGTYLQLMSAFVRMRFPFSSQSAFFYLLSRVGRGNLSALRRG